MPWLPETIPPMQLKEFCERLAVDYRAARYVLEEGSVPKGVEKHPERGNHRALTAAQAYWPGFLLYLKQSGVKSPIAAKVADFATESVNTLSQNLSYDPSFSPFKCRLQTGRQWNVEIGDLEVIRISIDQNPSGRPYGEFLKLAAQFPRDVP